MSPVEWYYARENQQAGPVSAAELKRLADAGQLQPDDLVWREGMPDWAPAHNVRGLFAEAVPVAAVSPVAAVARTNPAQPLRHPFDGLIDWSRTIYGPRFVETAARVMRTCGAFGMLAAMLLVVVFSVSAAIKISAATYLLGGATTLVLLIALQYTALKATDAIERLNAATPGRLPSSALPDALAALAKALGAAALLGTILTAVNTHSVGWVVPGVMALLVGGYWALLAINPSSVGVTVGEEIEPSEESIGMITFLAKVSARASLAVYGLGALAGTLGMGYACWVLFRENLNPTVFSSASTMLLYYSAAAPLLAYLSLLFYWLMLELCRAVLSLPGKLERPAAKDDNQPQE
jgi:hypothetical protein